MRLYLMLVRGWARRCITGIGIRSAVLNIGLIILFRLAAPRAQLPAQEHGKPEQERCGHDQRRRERLQISDHVGASLFRCSDASPGIVTHDRTWSSTGPSAPMRHPAVTREEGPR